MLVGEIHYKSLVDSAFNSQAVSTDTTTAGNIIDTMTFEALEFIFQSGTITDGTYTVSLEEGDDAALADAAAVSADETLGSISFVAADDNTAKRIGYIGKKRYVRASVVSTGTSTGGTLAGSVIRVFPMHQPTPNQ